MVHSKCARFGQKIFWRIKNKTTHDATEPVILIVFLLPAYLCGKTTTENVNNDFYVIPVEQYKEKEVIYPFVDSVTDSCQSVQQDKRLQSEFRCHNSWLFTSLTICHLHTYLHAHTKILAIIPFFLVKQFTWTHSRKKTTCTKNL